MGSIIKGICNNCNYTTSDLFFGAGMRNYQYYCGFTGIDKSDKEIRIENILEKNLVYKKNPNFIFHKNKGTFFNRWKISEKYIQWGDYRLNKTGHRCPKCNKKTISFSETGLFD